MKHNGMANRANRGIRDDVSYEVVFGGKYDRVVCDDTFKLLVWDCYVWCAWQFFQVKDRKGNCYDIPGNWNQYAGYFPPVAAVVQHDPLHPHEVRAERVWLISEKSLANRELWR